MKPDYGQISELIHVVHLPYSTHNDRITALTELRDMFRQGTKAWEFAQSMIDDLPDYQPDYKNLGSKDGQ